MRCGTCEHFCEIARKAWNLRHQEEHLLQILQLEYGDVGSFISANSIKRKHSSTSGRGVTRSQSELDPATFDALGARTGI
ncbi:MAG: hypothetical protein QXS68_01530 [Candidatus Methanomethylicaceae archaeon]